MKKFLFIINMLLVSMAFSVYCMEMPSAEKRLFIRNKRPDAVVITYQYQSSEFQDANLRRVVYPEEVIWIGNPTAILSLKLSPHGALWQYTGPEVWSLGLLKTEDYAPRIKSAVSVPKLQDVEMTPEPQGVEMTLSGSELKFYSVGIKPLSTSNIGAVIPLDRCKLLGDIFVRAREALAENKEIRPEYFLGVPAKPAKASRDFDSSVEKAHTDLLSGWKEAEYIPKDGLFDKEGMLDPINRATIALRIAGEYNKFNEYARKLFERSQRKYSEALCPVRPK